MPEPPRQRRPQAPKPAPIVRGEPLDRQTARKLEGGRLPVEAKLDLHGLRQRDAHAELKRFLKSAQGKGYRHVLVITGKGAAADTTRSYYEGTRAACCARPCRIGLPRQILRVSW